MWIINRKLVFIAHPKMASRSVRDAIVRLKGRQCGSHHEIVNDELEKQRERGASIGCVIRNPYDVMVSWYYHMEKRHGRKGVRPFSKWIREVIANGNGHLEYGMYKGYHLCDTVMHFENLDEDWKAWTEKCGLRHEPLGYVGVSLARSYAPYCEHYDQKAYEAVTNHFAKEIELGGYKFEGELCG